MATQHLVCPNFCFFMLHFILCTYLDTISLRSKCYTAGMPSTTMRAGMEHNAVSELTRLRLNASLDIRLCFVRVPLAAGLAGLAH